MKIELALPVVMETLGLNVEMSDELLMMDNIEKLIVLSLTDMKDKLKIKA